MIKKIYIAIIALLITVSGCAAEEIITTTKTQQQESSILQPLSDIDINYYKDSPLYQPFQPAKNEVVFNYSKNRINAIDPTPSTNKAGSYLPGTRGPNQLVIYTPLYGTRTNTNEFGAEAVVDGNTVTDLSGADSLIPPNGIVISGHGNAKNWINSNINIGTKIYVDRDANLIHTFTTSDSYIFETEKKISEAQQMIEFYKANPDYNWKVPNSYINDARDYLKKAQKNPEEVQKYSKLAIEAANDAIKSVVPYKSNELKGVWVRPVEKTCEDIIRSLEIIRAAGIDNVFLETYYHGKTIFPSKTMSAYGFTTQYEQFEGIDPLRIWICEAHKRNMKVHIWFETFYVGNTNPKDNPNSILAKNPSWGNKTRKDYSSVDPTKSSSEHNGYFLDPANPFVQDFLMKLLDEIITDYKPDGINLDYIRYPNAIAQNIQNSWGYTYFARNEFKEMYGVDPVELNLSDPLWAQWDNYRREKVTNFVRKVGALGKEKKVYTTAVIFPDRQAALSMKQQDWRTWSVRNYIQGFTPLFLTCDSKMANAMMQDVIRQKSPDTDFYAGIFVTFMSGSEEDLIRQIHEARKLNANGVIIFDYAHLSPKYANTLAKSVFASKSALKTVPPARTEPTQKQNIQKTPKKKPWWKWQT